MRVVGMDIHRSFAQVAILEKGQITKELRVDLAYRAASVKSAKALRADDEVVIEATGNSAAVERLMRPYVKRIAVANSALGSGQLRMPGSRPIRSMLPILARLHASGFLPEVWVADEDHLATSTPDC